MLIAPDTINIIQPVPDYTGPAAPPQPRPAPSSPAQPAPPTSAFPIPTSAPGDPLIIDGPRFHPVPATAGSTPAVGSPSIGYGYTPPPSGQGLTINVPSAGTDTSPTTLPTVTTWGTALGSHTMLIAAIALGVVLLVAIRRWK